MTFAGLRQWLGARAIPLGLAALAYGLAFAQRPGIAVADTKIDLHVDPGQFLGDVASVWSSSGGLGQVQAGQYAGYLFPMGPFFALGEQVGLAPWVVERLWLGTLLAVAAWGVVRLLDATLERPRGAAHLAAGAVTVMNPYVVVFANRTSVTLLGYAALPWLLLTVRRGVGAARGWRWPAAFALLVASTGGGVNAAVTGWLLLGPVLLAVWEPLTGRASWRAVGGFGWRAALLSVVASLWWLVPVAAHARYGLNFLPFTEGVGTIWDTTSLSESLRLLGYWVAYHGVGYGAQLEPYFSDTETLLFAPAVVVAGLLVSGLALGGFVWSRRLSYGPFFVALAFLGLLVMFAGFPPGTPLRRGLTFAYNHVEAIQFLRTTYKAGALTAIAVACLGGMAFGEVWRRVPVGGARSPRRTIAAAALAAGGAALLAVACWPLVTGRAIDSSIAYDHVPRAWTDAARDLDRDLPRSSRAMVLPGQVFPYYRWGDTQDPILPALSERPVAVRYVVPYSGLHAADMLFATDALVQQGRALPGQLPRLLSLLGVRAVVTGTDDDRFLSGAAAPADAERALRRGGLADPARRYGPERRFGATHAASSPEPARSARRLARAGSRPTIPLPEVRRTDLPSSRSLVRVYPASPETVVDGSGDGVASLAALGALPVRRAVAYAGDLSGAALRASARRGDDFVISDTNRRRTFVSSDPLPATGTTLAADVDFSQDAAVLDPFAERGTAGQTVAEYPGARRLESPFSPHFRQFPEHRAFAAFDGDPRTWWEPDFHLADERRWLEITFDRPRPVSHVDVLPKRVDGARVTAIDVAGRRVPLHPGWNRIRLGLREASGLRVRVADVQGPEGEPGSLAEVRVPGVHLREVLRPPQLVERALRGADLRHSSLSYVFTRATSDLPYDRPPGPGGEPEQSVARVIEPPAQRSYVLDAWVSRTPGARASGRGASGRAATDCDIGVRVGGRVVRMRPVSDVSGPVRAEQCGPPVRLPARRAEVLTEPGRFRVDLLRLRSPAPAGAARPVGGGRVLDPGDETRGSYDGVRLAVDGPSWLVLGESFNAGWKASCGGEDLGEPAPLDGYANGWRVDRGCRVASFEFGPNRTARISYAISALGCLAMLALVALPRRRQARWLAAKGPLEAGAEGRGETRNAVEPEAAPANVPGTDRVQTLSPLRAAFVGVAVAVVCGFAFGLRAGVVLGPLVAVLLWRGAGARALCLAAAGLLVVLVPLLYLVMLPGRTGGGFDTDYAKDLVPPHWVTLGALVLLALALWRTLVSRASRRSDDQAPEPEAATPERVPA